MVRRERENCNKTYRWLFGIGEYESSSKEVRWEGDGSDECEEGIEGLSVLSFSCKGIHRHLLSFSLLF